MQNKMCAVKTTLQICDQRVKKKAVKSNITKLKDEIHSCINFADKCELKLFVNNIIILNNKLNTVFTIIIFHFIESDIGSFTKEQ